MGPDNQNNFPNSNPLGDNMPVMGAGSAPEPQPVPGSNQPVMSVPQSTPELEQPIMGVPQPVSDVQSQLQPTQSEPMQPESTLSQLNSMQSEPESLQPMMPQQPSMPTGGPTFTDKSSAPKSKRNLIIIGTVAGVVVIALIIAVIVIMNSGKKSSQPATPVYNTEVTEPDENGDINGEGNQEGLSEADAQRTEDYSAVITAVESFAASNNGEISKLVQTKNPASLNPTKWINETGKDPDGNSYELKAYSFGKWQSEGDLAPAISDTTNGAQAFIIIGANCGGTDANGNPMPVVDTAAGSFAVYGYLENGVFCKDNKPADVTTTETTTSETTTEEFDF